MTFGLRLFKPQLSCLENEFHKSLSLIVVSEMMHVNGQVVSIGQIQTVTITFSSPILECVLHENKRDSQLSPGHHPVCST